MNFGRNDYNEIFKNVESQIPEDEPVFLFRGTDPLVPRLLLNYATEMRLMGTDPRVADSVVAHAQRIIDWQKAHPTKHADLVHESEDTIRDKARISELIESLEVDGYLPELKLTELCSLVDVVCGANRYRLVLPNEHYDQTTSEQDRDYDLVIAIKDKTNMELLWVSKRL